ncbi:MAG TPA: HD domain-containing protein [Bacteroidales bacterium]|nr:HD domain-containing protein [Bacteroidales bacterium]
MYHPESVYRAEKKYISHLEHFFTRVWGETNLHSHDIDHHRRVWLFAKELLTSLYNEEKSAPVSAEKVLIASYLHDAGMSLDSGVNHGVHSRSLCSKFLADNNLPENEFTEVLEAIEMHDNKDVDYSLSPNHVLKILAAADDLDAFGFIGIYRYSEIYLAREIPPERIGYMIRKNAGLRFENFKAAFWSSQALITKHSERYFILDDFFSAYNNQVPGYRFGNQNPSGYCGVIEYLNETGIKKDSAQRLVAGSLLNTSDQTINWYFKGLLNELHHFSQL